MFIQEVQVSVQQDGADCILEGGFDVLFSVLDNFHKEVPTELKFLAFEVLTVAMNDLIRTTDQFLCSCKSRSDQIGK